MKPMLASNAELKKIRYPVLVSPKLDGVRATVQDDVVLSRTGKPIPNKYVQDTFKTLEKFDGELIVGSPTDEKVFQKTTSGVMSIEGTPDVCYYVFDVLFRDRPFEERYRFINSFKENNKVKKVPQFSVSNEESLLQYEQMFLTQGYEGLMIRDSKAPYKEGRSTVKEGYLLKLKRFTDTEAKVVKMLPLIHEDGSVEDTLGALVVSYEDDQGVTKILKIGSGFTSAERLDIWNNSEEYIGKLVKFKYFEKGTKDLPRFPILLALEIWRIYDETVLQMERDYERWRSSP